ncbi:MAG: hypothetical protein AAFQ22_04590 [Pseudomonadota bacterium]
MDLALKVGAGLPAAAFVLLGLSWWIVPDFASAQLGMSMLNGIGLSSQIGDVASFFLTLGACILIAIASRNRFWLYPAIMLLALATIGRLLAWAVHDAALATQMIAVEWIVLAVLFLLSRRLEAPS